MKVLIGQFINEANANIPVKDEITTFDIAFGDELIEKMQVGDIFEAAGIEIIPSIYAVSGSSGVIAITVLSAPIRSPPSNRSPEIPARYLA